MGFFVPARRRGHEILDDASVDTKTRIESIADVTWANRLFGGRRAAVLAVEAAMESTPLTVLDVGTGLADIPAEIAARASRRGARITTIGLDERADLLVAARARANHMICASVRALPFRSGSIDIVLCSQLLHHFEAADLASVITELNRVARQRVVIADLRRSRFAAAGFWLASFPLRFHPVTRHDGVVSVFRGFTAAELRAAIWRAVGVAPAVRQRAGFRLTASWKPNDASDPVRRLGTRSHATGLGPMPAGRRMTTTDERLVRAPLERIFALAADVERWPTHLRHYRYVRLHRSDAGNGGLVEMSANRPLGPIDWPTRWTSEMEIHPPDGTVPPAIRFLHVGGITTGMDVEWSFTPVTGGTLVRIIHVWDGPQWPAIGGIAATAVIGPVFIHGIASRTLAGLAHAAERSK